MIVHIKGETGMSKESDAKIEYNKLTEPAKIKGSHNFHNFC